MSVTDCTYDGRRDEILVAYLYEDMEPAERDLFAAHLPGCAACRTELDDLTSVRADLARWTPPEPAHRLSFAPPAPRRPARIWSALADVPAWAQIAAALLVLGIAAGIANLNVQYDRDGFSVRTGWMPPANAGPAFRSADSGDTSELKIGPPVASAGGQAADPAPWRAELAALEQSFRAQMQHFSATPQPARSGADDAELLRRVRAIVEASERNQRRELALRVAEVARDMQAHRLADLQRIQRTLNVIENATGGAIVRQGRVLNDLRAAVRVSQQQ